MTKSRNEYEPTEVTPPGETLQEILDDRCISQSDLARRMGRPVKTINEIIHGKAAITPETALQLEHALGVPASFWNDFERRYRESLTLREELLALEQNVDWLEEVPWREMARRGWIQSRKTPALIVRELLDFFGVASYTAWKNVCAKGVDFRMTRTFQSDPGAVTAWLRQGERQAVNVACEPYSEAFSSVIADLRKLTLLPTDEGMQALTEKCARYGVAVVYVPELRGTRICGAARWLSTQRALVQLSLRYKTEDSFWFSVFHEMAHVILHGKRKIFIDFHEDSKEAHEREADTFAADSLIPPMLFQPFAAEGVFTNSSIQAFAKQAEVSPGIVVGRLQHERLVPWKSHLGGLKRRVDFP